MSEAAVTAVRVGKVTPHPNADYLSITYVYDGYPVIFRTGEFVEGDLAVYVPVDSLVPLDSEHFAFLDENKGKAQHRVRARRLRGLLSMGMLVHPEPGVNEGDDCTALYRVEHYVHPAEREPVAQTKGSKVVRSLAQRRYERRVWTGGAVAIALGAAATYLAGIPPVFFVLYSLAALGVGEYYVQRQRRRSARPRVPYYDIEGYRKHSHVLKDGEEVWISEKIHGANGVFVHNGRRFYARSRTTWREETDNWWSKVAAHYDLERKLAAYPNIALFGELYGPGVQDLTYGASEGRFVAFDAYDVKERKFLPVDDFLAMCRLLNIPVVPTLYRGPWNPELLTLAEGQSTMALASHTREGIVIRPVEERRAPNLGRVILKMAGEDYLLRKEVLNGAGHFPHAA